MLPKPRRVKLTPNDQIPGVVPGQGSLIERLVQEAKMERKEGWTSPRFKPSFTRPPDAEQRLMAASRKNVPTPYQEAKFKERYVASA